MRVFGIDPGTVRTGYGCVDTDGTRHRLVDCGTLTSSAAATISDRLRVMHRGLGELLRACAPDCVAIESLFYARNVRSALLLGHVRGVAMLAVVEAGLTPFEYSPAEIKAAVTGYGRAEKSQVQQMIKLLLGLDTVPSPHDAADALAVALCHAHATGSADVAAPAPVPRHLRSWRHARLPVGARRQAP